MMDAADAAGMTPAETQKLMWQASMPAAESTNPHAEWRAKNAPEGAAIVAIDWVRFGYLLRHQLGWDDSYPDHPAERAWFRRLWRRRTLGSHEVVELRRLLRLDLDNGYPFEPKDGG